jgi:hypothetical protein
VLTQIGLDSSIDRNLAKSEEAASGEIQIDTVSATMSETTGNKFANGASQRAFMETVNAGKALQKLNAQQTQRDAGALTQLGAYAKGVLSFPLDVGRTIITAGSTLCEGFSQACAANVENSRRIGRSIYDYNNDPEIRARVALANDVATQVVLNNPIVQSQVAGRATVTAILTTFGPVGAGFNALALTGGALRASEAAGETAQINDFVQGALGVK